MPPSFSRSTQGVSLFLALTLSSLAILIVSTNTRYLDTVEDAIRWLSQPIVKVGNSPANLIETTEIYFSSREQLEAEIEKLSYELSMVQTASAELQDTKSQLNELRTRIGELNTAEGHQVIAEIVTVNPNQNRQEIVISRGAADGIVPNSVVLDGRGVRGRVIEVFDTTSRVLEVHDKRSGTPVLNVRTGEYFVASGNGLVAPISLDNVNINADIELGDEFVTSGIGEDYPRGFSVGTVNEVVDELNQAMKHVELTPSSDLKRKSFLRIVVKDEHF